MGKKVIISENVMKRIIAEEMMSKTDIRSLLSNSDFEKKVKELAVDALKSDKKAEKDMEKKVKAMVATCVNKLFYTLWQRNQFWSDTIKNA